MTIYRGLGGVNREVKKQFRGVSGVNRETKEQYRGLSGVNWKVFTNDVFPYIIKDGILTARAGGWSQNYVTDLNYYSQALAIQEQDSIYCGFQNENRCISAIMTNNPIDTTEYSKLNIEYEGFATPYGRSGAGLKLGDFDYINDVTSPNPKLEFQDATHSRRTTTMNITTNGLSTISIFTRVSTGYMSSAWIRVFNMWLS